MLNSNPVNRREEKDQRLQHVIIWLKNELRKIANSRNSKADMRLRALTEINHLIVTMEARFSDVTSSYLEVK